MRYEAPYCQWCRNRPGGCMHCPPKQLVPETRKEELAYAVMQDDQIYAIQEVRQITTYRVPKPHPDRILCEPDPALARFVARSYDDRTRFALCLYDPTFAKWQLSFQTKRRRSGRRWRILP